MGWNNDILSKVDFQNNIQDFTATAEFAAPAHLPESSPKQLLNMSYLNVQNVLHECAK